MIKRLFKKWVFKRECDHNYIDLVVGESESFGEIFSPYCIKCGKYDTWKVYCKKEDPLKWC